jgi:hypothetical protein
LQSATSLRVVGSVWRHLLGVRVAGTHRGK